MLTLIAAGTALGGTAVVPTREIAAGETLGTDDIEWVDWPDALGHPDLIADLDDADRRVARVSLLPGEPLRDQRLYPRGHRGLSQTRTLVTLPLAHPTAAWAPGTHLDVLSEAAGPACVIAQRGQVLEGVRGEALIRDGGVPADALRLALGLHDAARLAHAAATGVGLVPVARSPDDEALALLTPCDLLQADRVDVPPGGWSVGVDPPAVQARVDDPEGLLVVPMGGTDWWHLLPRGDGPFELVLDRGEGLAPVLLDVVPHPRSRDGSRVHVPVAGAVVVPLGGPVVYAHVEPPGAIEVQQRGEHVVLLGRSQADVVRVTARAEGQEPRTWSVSAAASWPQSREPELVVRAGRTRAVRLDHVTQHALTAEATIATVQTTGGHRVKVRGEVPGRTTAVLFADDGSALTVRVVVTP